MIRMLFLCSLLFAACATPEESERAGEVVTDLRGGDRDCVIANDGALLCFDDPGCEGDNCQSPSVGGGDEAPNNPER